MLQKKKFIIQNNTKVDKKNANKMYSARNIKWLKYLILSGLICFILLLILSNIRSKSYYESMNPKGERHPAVRTILSLDDATARLTDCTNNKCVVLCSGNLDKLNKYLESLNCAAINLTISDYSFNNDRLKSNWLQGNFKLNHIYLKNGILKEIQDGAFYQQSVASMVELEFNGVQLGDLSEYTFSGLNSIETFTLINQAKRFSAKGFLKPMEKTLKKVVIKHTSDEAIDPAPWFAGGTFAKLMMIILNGSNFGGYIKDTTFSQIKGLYYLFMDSCKINYIPHGAFDFLKDKYLFLISLERNQLTHLSGDYLTKVSGLKNVGLQYNPWDCTCELEQLVTEYERYPNGFGNLTCNTPPALAGSDLSEVNVKKCHDTNSDSTSVSTPSTTFSSEDPSTESSTTEGTFSTSTDIQTPSTTSSTEAPSTESNNSTLSPEAPSTESSTSSTTTSSTETPSTEPNTSSTVNTSVSTDSSLEDPSTTTPRTFSPSTDSTPVFITDYETTGGTLPTTPTPQNRTTTLSADLIFIECQRYTANSKTNSSNLVLEVSPQDAFFQIVALSETSALLKFEEPTEDLAIIWFFDQPSTTGSGESVRIVEEFKVGCQSELEYSLTVEGLVPKQAYSFCLFKEGAQVISPFNCRSYYTSEEEYGKVSENEIWIKHEDKALVIGLFVLGINIAICIGVMGMFLVLRYYPTLLKGSKRVIVVNQRSREVLIMPKSDGKQSSAESSCRSSSNASTAPYQRRFSAVSVQSGRSYMVANNYEDVEHIWKMNAINDKTYVSRVPKDSPPPLPKCASRSSALYIKTLDKLKADEPYSKANDYVYLS